MEYEAQRFTEFLHAKKKTGHPKPLALLQGGKVNGKKFAMSCGVKVAGTLMDDRKSG